MKVCEYGATGKPIIDCERYKQLEATNKNLEELVEAQEGDIVLLQAKLEAKDDVLDEIYDKTIEGYVIEQIDVLRGDAVWGEDGTADYSEKAK